MNKKNYQAPALLIINVAPQAAMLQGGTSKMTIVVHTGEKHSATEAMSRQSDCGDWDDWDE